MTYHVTKLHHLRRQTVYTYRGQCESTVSYLQAE